MANVKITIDVVDRMGKHSCHRGHEIGDRFDFETQRGDLCPMAMHVLFPYVNILRYGGTLRPNVEHGDIRVCCPDSDVVNVFRVSVE